jgi:hypothetical protein
MGLFNRSNSPKDAFSRLVCEAFSVEIYNPAMMDVQPGSLYDTLEFGPGEQLPRSLYLFTEPSNASKPFGKTNLVNPKKLPAPEMFAVDRISFAVLEGSSAATEAQIKECCWHLYIGMKCYRRSTMSMMNIGAFQEVVTMRRCVYCDRIHVQQVCPGCGAAEFTAWASEQIPTSVVRSEHWLEHRPNLVILHNTEFYVTIDLSESIQGPLRLRCWLSGLHARGVQ